MRYLFRLFVPLNRLVYQRTGGRLGSSIRGAPILLLTTTGRKTGQRRTTPLLYLSAEPGLVVVGSAGGAPKDPAWILNLRADASADVQIGREHRAVVAREAAGDERARLWTRLVEMYPAYDDYRQRTTREIPVIVVSAP